MKITVTDTDSVLTAIVLGDDSTGSDYITEPPLPSESRQVQTEPLPWFSYPFVVGRGNRDVSFSWTVARQHSTKGAASDFCKTHAPLVPVNCSLSILEGSTTTTYSRAIMGRVECVEINGVSTRFRYSVTGVKP